MKRLSYLITFLLFIITVALAPGIVRDSLADQQAKADLAEVNHIMYGIFSVNAWKAKLSEVIFSEIRRLDLKTTTAKLKATIESQLSAVIDKLNEQIRAANQSSFGGRAKQVLIDLVIDVEDVKKKVPEYADTLIAEFTKPETDKAVKDMAAQQLKSYLQKTFTEQDTSLLKEVLERTGTSSVKAANQKLLAEIESRRQNLALRGYSLIGVVVLMFSWVGLSRSRSRFDFAMLFLSLTVLLGIGVSIPMIDLEAKIATLSFSLIGHEIVFENQIMYFQSKSVLDVFWLMITHSDPKMKIVGVLLVLFSVIFPVLKMAATVAFHYFEKSRSSGFVRFFAFKIGKWSMADVLVVAILMAYIGFNGIVETQFGKMKELVPKDMTFITTNGTTLQLGFYVFFAYAILALVLSAYLSSIHKKQR